MYYKNKIIILYTYIMYLKVFILILLLILFVICANRKKMFLNYSFHDLELIDRTRSKYQTIELVSDKQNNYCLFLNGDIQNHNKECYLSHDAMVNVSIYLCKIDTIENILILGGGDAYPAMIALEHPQVKIRNVEIDDTLIDFVKTNEKMKELTNNAFNNKRVELFAKDAYEYIYTDKNQYDIIIHDIDIDTNQQFYYLEDHDYYIMKHLLKENGVLNYTTDIIDPVLTDIQLYYDNLGIEDENKYHILLFESADDFLQLEHNKEHNKDSYFIFDPIILKKEYPNSEVGIMFYENNEKTVKCGNVSYDDEAFIYISKNGFNKSNSDIQFHKYNPKKN